MVAEHDTCGQSDRTGHATGTDFTAGQCQSCGRYFGWPARELGAGGRDLHIEEDHPCNGVFMYT